VLAHPVATTSSSAAVMKTMTGAQHRQNVLHDPTSMSGSSQIRPDHSRSDYKTVPRFARRGCDGHHNLVDCAVRQHPCHWLWAERYDADRLIRRPQYGPGLDPRLYRREIDFDSEMPSDKQLLQAHWQPENN